MTGQGVPPTFTRGGAESSLFYLDTASLGVCSAPYAAAFLPLQPLPPATQQVDLPTSWSTSPGYYLFLGGQPADEAIFLEAFSTIFGYPGLNDARFIWLENPNDAVQLWRFSAIGVPSGSATVSRPARVTLRNFALALPSGTGAALSSDNASITFTAGATGLTFATRWGGATLAGVGSIVTLPFHDQALGCLQFSLTLPSQAVRTPTRPDGLDLLDAGCRFFTDSSDFFNSGLLNSYRYPIFNLARRGLTLNASIDPILPTCGDRTSFAFDVAPPVQALDSFYTSTLGVPLQLTPTATSRFVLEVNRSSQTPQLTDGYYLAPAGDFVVSVPQPAVSGSGNDQPIGPTMMCGLSGVEYVALSPNAPVTLSFEPTQNAYSPIKPPLVVNGTNTYRELSGLALTSWAYLSSTPPLPYYAQPDSSVLFKIRQGDTNPSTNQFLDYAAIEAGTLAPPVGGATAPFFPMVPYAGVLDAIEPDTLAQLEVQVLSPQRRSIIYAANHAGGGATLAPSIPSLAAGSSGGPVQSTTPGGLMVTYDPANPDVWTTLTVATTPGATLQLANVKGALKSALQTNQLFLVISSATKLSTCCTIAGGQVIVHDYELSIEDADSPLLADGVVMIFKFMNKSIADLVKDTSSWTGAADFNDDVSATALGLQQLVQAAIASQDPTNPQDAIPDLAGFVSMVTSSTWNGVLILNATIPELPTQLEGLVPGIDPKLFVAHHVGINISPVTNSGTALTMGNTSIFGFINYDNTAQMVFNGDPYQFRVKSLRVLFQNSAVKDFSSVVQLWVNIFFGEPAALQNASNGNEIDFYGVYQDHDGTDSYLFLSQADYVFDVKSQVVSQVEVQKAQYTTVSVTPGPNTGQQTVISRFTFWGNIRFHALSLGNQVFDLFSFGPEPNTPTGSPGQLSFGNLFLGMTSVDAISQGAASVLSTTYALDTSQMTFDMASSVARPTSLFNHFPLTLTGLIQGQSGSIPTGLGFIQVDTPLVQGTVADPWFALQFDLNLGTPGALAADLGFTASLLAAWSPNASGYTVFTGLKLPGSNGAKKEISVQGVLKITFAKIVFVVGAPGVYMLKLQNIAVSFMSKTLPPDGQTSIYIFGDPSPGANNRTLGWYAAYAKNPPKPGAKPQPGPPAGPSHVRKLAGRPPLPPIRSPELVARRLLTPVEPMQE